MSAWPDRSTVDAANIAWITESDMIEVGRIELLQLMENAGRNLARLVLDRFTPTRVVVVVDSGGNGGGRMVAARR